MIHIKLAELKKTMRERLHWSIPDLGKWIKSVVIGHCRYYGVPWNGKSLTRFRSEIIRTWCRSLRRSSHKHRITWKRMSRIARKWLPSPFTCHPYPLERMPGWISQWKQSMDDPKRKLQRPRQIYMGPKGREYVPIGERR